MEQQYILDLATTFTIFENFLDFFKKTQKEFHDKKILSPEVKKARLDQEDSHKETRCLIQVRYA